MPEFFLKFPVAEKIFRNTNGKYSKIKLSLPSFRSIRCNGITEEKYFNR